MNYFTKLMMVVLLGYGVSKGNAQEDESQEVFHPHHTLGFMLSHTQIFQGVQNDGEKKWLALPSIALNYNYKFHEYWSIGLHNDIVIEDYEVAQHLRTGSSSDNEILTRSYPIASAVVTSYKPGKHFSYLLGAGGEFAHSGNLFMIRVGIEYGLHMNQSWELNVNLVNDLKLNAYNSIAYGIGVTKVF